MTLLRNLIALACLGPALAVAAPYCFDVEGDLDLPAGATLTIEIGGTQQACSDTDSTTTEFDRVAVSGVLSLGGDLRILLINGYVPDPADRIDILDWGSLSGSFASVDLSQAVLPEGYSWDLDDLYSSGEVGVIAPPAVQSVPLPAWSMGLLAVGLFAAYRRR